VRLNGRRNQLIAAPGVTTARGQTASLRAARETGQGRAATIEAEEQTAKTVTNQSSITIPGANPSYGF